jgi:hypothetical protein
MQRASVVTLKPDEDLGLIEPVLAAAAVVRHRSAPRGALREPRPDVAAQSVTTRCTEHVSRRRGMI